jgi:hypothetical protein
VRVRGTGRGRCVRAVRACVCVWGGGGARPRGTRGRAPPPGAPRPSRMSCTTCGAGRGGGGAPCGTRERSAESRPLPLRCPRGERGGSRPTPHCAGPPGAPIAQRAAPQSSQSFRPICGAPRPGCRPRGGATDRCGTGGTWGGADRQRPREADPALRAPVCHAPGQDGGGAGGLTRAVARLRGPRRATAAGWSPLSVPRLRAGGGHKREMC